MNRCHKELSLATRELSSSLFTILTMYYATVDVSWWSPCKPAMGVTGKWWCDNDSSRSAGSRILYTIWGEIFEDNKYKSPFVILNLMMMYVILCSVEWCSDWDALWGIILATGWLDENHEKTYTGCDYLKLLFCELIPCSENFIVDSRRMVGINFSESL